MKELRKEKKEKVAYKRICPLLSKKFFEEYLINGAGDISFWIDGDRIEKWDQWVLLCVCV